jgi:putative ABC transport system permease protein
MIVAIDIANGSASQAFELSTDSIVGQATHQIVAAPDDLPSELYRQLRVDLGLRQVAPTVTGLVLLPQADDLPLQLLGVDPFAEGPFRNYLGDGNGEADGDALLSLLIEPNTVMLSQSLAERYGLASGQMLTLQTGDEAKRVKLVGLLSTSDSRSRSALDGLLLSDISTAQEVLAKVGRLSTIDMILPDDFETQPILDRLPPNARLQQAALRNQTLSQMTAAFNLNLTAMSQLALVVGIFLIYNTISFSVVQRRPVLGTLRCLGITRREVFGLVLTEALVLSAIGALIGLGLGVALGRGLVGLVTQTINDLFFTTTVRSVAVPAFTLVKGVIAGLGAGFLGALIPAWEATSVPPSSALKRSVGEARVQKLVPSLTLVGLGFMGAGWAGLTLAGGSLTASFSAIFIILIGTAFLTPLMTQLLMRLVQPVTRRLLGIIGVMAPRDISRALSRTSVTIAALMMAVTVIIGVSIMINSFRRTVVTWLDSILVADIYASPAGQSLRLEGEIDPAFLEQVSQRPDVFHLNLLKDATVFDENYEPIEIRAVTPEPNEQRRQENMLWSIGAIDQVLARMDRGAIMITEVFARRFELPLDRPSTITLLTENGPRRFEIVGIFYDYALPEVGYVLMRLETYRRFWPQDQGISNASMFLTPEALPQADRITQDLRDQYAAAYRLAFSSNRGLKENALVVFDRTFTITTALRLLAMLVAFIGVLSALMSLQLERTRELGTLRANGMTLPQLWSKTLLETGLMGLTAGLMALPFGWALAYILIYFINLRSFGWSLQMQTDPGVFGLALVIAVVAALLAAIYPVLRLNRLEIAAAIRDE